MADVVVEPRARTQRTGPKSSPIPVMMIRLRGYHYLLLPVLLGSVSLLLRFHDIGHESLWLDEAYTLLFSHLPIGRLISVGGAHEHPPLYYSIVHLASSVHDSYLAPRVISAIAGSVAVVVLYALSARLYGWRVAAVASALLAVSPFHVWYAQDGRGYELAGLCVLLSYYLLWTSLDRPRLRTWAFYSVSVATCLYSEYSTVFVLAPQVVLWFEAKKRGLERRLLAAWAVALLLFVPWFGMLAVDAVNIASDYWIPSPTPGSVANTVMQFLGFMTPCPSPPCKGTEIGLPILAGNEVVLAGLVTLIAAALLLGLVARRCTREVVLLLWLVLPFVAVLALATKRSLYLDRIFLDATFPLYVLLAVAAVRAGRQRLMRGLLGIVAVLLVGGASVANLPPIYAGEVNPDWRSLARDFEAAYRPGQAVVFNPGVLQTLTRAYMPTGWRATYERPLWSRSYLDVPDWEKRYPKSITDDKEQRMREETRLRDSQFSDAARSRRQVWLITYDYPGMNDSRRWFSDRGFQLVLSQLYRGHTRLELWDRSPPAAFGHTIVPDDGFGSWRRSGNIRLSNGSATANGATVLTRPFLVRPGGAYSASVAYQGLPPASKPLVTVEVFDKRGASLAIFPRTEWYDWPVNGVWLSQPFGFVAPPSASYAIFRLRTQWGESSWRHVAVYKE